MSATQTEQPAYQLGLFQSGGKKQTLLRGITPSRCRVSRFNARKAHSPEAVEKLARRMAANGFEMTRALWAYRGDDGAYEVFAGGTRLEAAQRAGVLVDVVLHEGYTWEEISRLSDQDNENDEYHQPVRPMDVWAEYARLRDEEGWTQDAIARAKAVTKSMVSMRIKWHEGLPDTIKALVGSSNSILTEGHIQAVFTEVQTFELLAPWADTPAWRITDLEAAIQKKWSVRQLADQWQKRKDAVARANELVATLPDGTADEYILKGDDIQRIDTDWRAAFCAALIDFNATTAALVDRAFSAIVKRQQDSTARKAAYDANVSAAEQQAQEQQRRIEHLAARWLHGNCVDHLPTLDDGTVRLLLTDPPYGVAFQSNRRVASGKLDALDNDASCDQALAVFGAMLDAAAPKLAAEAHLLVFAHWKTEFDFRAALEARGYTVRGSLVWVRDNHGSGDLEGAFAPKHERIIHATKGHPTVSPRVDDVLMYPRGKETAHPTEKPVDLLKRLITCTTEQGDLVADPFGGTASTIIAAIATGREWWGCELNDAHWNDGYKRINDAHNS